MKARFGVYVAYKYYLSLFDKIKKSQPQVLLEDRIRIPIIPKPHSGPGRVCAASWTFFNH